MNKMKLKLEHYHSKHRIPFLGRFDKESSNAIIYKLVDMLTAFEEREIITEFVMDGPRIKSVHFRSADRSVRGEIDFVSLWPLAGDSIVVTVRMKAQTDSDLLEYHYLRKIIRNRENLVV